MDGLQYERRLLLFAIFLSSSLIQCLHSRTLVQIAIGQTAVLPCTVDIGGTIHVEWLDPGETLLTMDETVMTQDSRFAIRHPYLKEWNLEITNVRYNDAGNYTCRIRPVPLISKFVELRVATPPAITATSGANKYLAGSRVTLTCEAKGTPKPRITWHRLDEHHRGVDLKTEGNTYVIESIHWSAGGVYECHANNGFLPYATAVLTVEVLFAPIVRVPYREVIQGEGKWTLLTCVITANPKVDIYWTHNSVKIQNSATHSVLPTNTGLYQVTLRLSIESLSSTDFGTYKCIAANQYGKDEASVNLEGQQTKKALLTSTPKDTVVAVGEDTVINCTILNLPKQDSLVWWYRSTNNETRKLFESRSNSELTVSDAVKYDIMGQYNLFIRKTNYSDQGSYICQITGHENHSATLKVIASWDPTAICQKKGSDEIYGTLFILAAIFIALLVVAIIVLVVVFRVMMKKAAKDSSYPVELSAKISKVEHM